jgi:hypothetical protein
MNVNMFELMCMWLVIVPFLAIANILVFCVMYRKFKNLEDKLDFIIKNSKIDCQQLDRDIDKGIERG